jgi:hypothetical protein
MKRIILNETDSLLISTKDGKIDIIIKFNLIQKI